ncbi:MAG TPA: hypothetical protein VFQ68_16315 [Streptosporangiaceae bacterium]|nr:hypothetical protein [Streptosporangiaceae bacterium]
MDQLDADLVQLTYTEAASGGQKAAAAAGLAEFRAGFVADLERSLGWLEGDGAQDSQALPWARWCAQAVQNWDTHFLSSPLTWTA